MRFGEMGAVYVFVIIFFIGVVLFSGKRKDINYDERQALYRGRGYLYAFFAVIGCNLIYGFLGTGIFPVDPDLMVMVIALFGVGTYCVYCAWKDAYIGVRQNWKKVMWSLALIGAIDLFNGITIILSGRGVENGRLSQSTLSLFIGILFLVLCGVLTARNLRRDNEE